MATVEIEKARTLAAHNRRIETRARPLAMSLARWLERYSRVLVDRELSRQVRKASEDDRLREELEQLLRLFGLRQLEDAAQGAAGSSVLIPSSAISDFLATKTVEVTGIMDQTRDGIREEIKALLSESLAQTPTPSAGEIARRIRSSYFGPEDVRPFSVSSERAALIARTELVQAENSGIDAGYRAVASEGDEYEWIAYSDGKSGDRHHERLDGKRIPVGGVFVTPKGNRLRYPGDPQGAIEDTANCRCSFRLVRSRTR